MADLIGLALGALGCACFAIESSKVVLAARRANCQIRDALEARHRFRLTMIQRALGER